MDGAGEANAPVKVGTVSKPTIFEPVLPLPPNLLAALLCEPPPLPAELASLTNTPRVLVVPLGSTRRIEELGGSTEWMLIFGILTYPGLTTFSLGGGFWPKLLAARQTTNSITIHGNVNRCDSFIKYLLRAIGIRRQE
jgi:hypothetical protein